MEHKYRKYAVILYAALTYRGSTVLDGKFPFLDSVVQGDGKETRIRVLIPA